MTDNKKYYVGATFGAPVAVEFGKLYEAKSIRVAKAWATRNILNGTAIVFTGKNNVVAYKDVCFDKAWTNDSY